MNKIPLSVPEALRPLFGCSKPGDQISYSLSDPLFQAIRTYHPTMKSVGRYSKLLLNWNPEHKDGELSPPSVVTAKANMVTEVLAFYKVTRTGNPTALKARIEELEEQLRRKDLALQAANRRITELERSRDAHLQQARVA